MNSVGAALRNTFMNKIPTPEDISATCTQLAQRLILDEASRTECKLALVDLLDEALQGNSHTVPNLHFMSKNSKEKFLGKNWTFRRVCQFKISFKLNSSNAPFFIFKGCYVDNVMLAIFYFHKTNDWT